MCLWQILVYIEMAEKMKCLFSKFGFILQEINECGTY